MTVLLLVNKIKSPKPKPMIRVPDNVMTPYNAQVSMIPTKYLEAFCIFNFIFSYTTILF